MKKTAILAALSAAAFCALSCQKESASEASESKQPLVIRAESEPLDNTKSQVAFTHTLLWETDDIICVTQSTKYDTFKLVSGAGTKQGTFQQQGSESFDGPVEAWYPSSMIAGTGSSPVWPSVQTVGGGVPLYCKKNLSGSGDEDFRFSSLGAVLQIVFNTALEDVTLTSIELSDGVKTMSGAFEVADGKAVITADDKSGITLDLGAGVALDISANYFNIAVPEGDYQNLTLVFNAADGRTCTMTGGKVALARNEVGKLTLTGNKFKYLTLPGEFSVADGRKVRFTRGNLYYNGSTFGMEDAQYDCPTSWSSSHVGFFGWNKDAVTAAKGTKEAFVVNGELFTNKDELTPNPEFTVCSLKGMFRILSIDEWNYVVGIGEGREDARDLRKIGVNVCGKAGCLVLAPDGWTGTIQDSYDSAGWRSAETEGLVCFPPAGYWDYKYQEIYHDATYCWSSTYTPWTGQNFHMHIFMYGDSVGDYDYSGHKADDVGPGCTVRLVLDVK